MQGFGFRGKGAASPYKSASRDLRGPGGWGLLWHGGSGEAGKGRGVGCFLHHKALSQPGHFLGEQPEVLMRSKDTQV